VFFCVRGSGAGLTHVGAAAGGEAAGMPLSPNFASPQGLGGLRGVSAGLARRIVEARGESGFASVSEFRTRAHISDREWDVLKNHLLIL
jgi:DNA uptake protein ComE-like DNA-binding protein